MVRWHHRVHGHEIEQIPGDSEGPGSLARCSPQRVGHNLAAGQQELLNICSNSTGIEKGDTFVPSGPQFPFSPTLAPHLPVLGCGLSLHLSARRGSPLSALDLNVCCGRG